MLGVYPFAVDTSSSRRSTCPPRRLDAVASVAIEEVLIAHHAPRFWGDAALHAEYVISVRVSGKQNHEHTIRKRFSEFQRMAAELRPRAKYARALPELPPKRVMGELEPSVVEERRAGLEAWLRAACAASKFQSATLNAFLQLPRHLDVRLRAGDTEVAELVADFCGPSPRPSPDSVAASLEPLSVFGGGRSSSPTMAEGAPPASRPHFLQAARALATTLDGLRADAAAAAGDAAAAAASSPGGGDDVGRGVHDLCGGALFPPSAMVCAAVLLRRLPPALGLLDGAQWKLTLLAVLSVASKISSDYRISAAAVCAAACDGGGFLPPFALTPRRLARAERGVLRALEYQTFVSPEAFGASLALAFGLPEVAVPEPLKRLNTA